MKTKSYEIMYEIKKENYNFPKTIQELAILIQKSERNKKLFKLNEKLQND